MLIKCPKCGFSQPQDHYCARCGVDMETFKPAPESTLKKIFLSPVFQIGLIIAIIGSATTFVMNRKHLMSSENLRTNVRTKAYTNSDIDQTVVANTEASETHAASVAPTEASDTPQPTLATATDTPSTEASESALPAVKAEATAAPSTPATAAANHSTTHGHGIRVSYTMIDNGFLGRIYEDSQATGQFATFASYNAGLIPDIEKKLNPANTRIRVLHKVEERVEEGKSKSWFLGSRTPEGDEVGLTTTIEFKEIDSSGVFRGSFLITRSWRDKTTYPAEVEIAPQNGFFISGVLPRSLPEGMNASITSISPFDVLKEAAFRSKAAEFVIFLELTK